MDVRAHYRAPHEHSRVVLQEMLDDDIARAALTASRNCLFDYDRVKIAIASRPEAEVLAAAVKEYQFALFALANGPY